MQPYTAAVRNTCSKCFSASKKIPGSGPGWAFILDPHTEHLLNLQKLATTMIQLHLS
jgi:hypothetical protein